MRGQKVDRLLQRQQLVPFHTQEQEVVLLPQLPSESVFITATYTPHISKEEATVCRQNVLSRCNLSLSAVAVGPAEASDVHMN